MGRVLVLGGTGTISAPAVRELAAMGHEVALFNRGRRPSFKARDTDVVRFRGDRRDTKDLVTTLSVFQPDAVLDFIGYRPAEAAELDKALIGAPSVRHLVYTSSMDAYGYPLRQLPATESLAPRQPIGSYATNKLESERYWQGVHATGRFAATITRPSYCVGSHSLMSLSENSALELVRRIRAGPPVAIPETGEGMIHVSTGEDAGRMHAALTLNPAAGGRIFNVGSPNGAMTHLRYYKLIAAAAGCELRAVPVSRKRWDAAFGEALAASLWHRVFSHDLWFDYESFERTCGPFSPGPPLEESIAACVRRWHDEGLLCLNPDPTHVEARLAAAAEGGASRRFPRAGVLPEISHEHGPASPGHL